MAILILTLVLALLAAIGAVIFAIGNSGVIPVHFLFSGFDSSLTPLLLAAFALGLILGVLITIPASIRKSCAIAGNNKEDRKPGKENTAQT
jgi:hypothetical protein